MIIKLLSNKTKTASSSYPHNYNNENIQQTKANRDLSEILSSPYISSAAKLVYFHLTWILQSENQKTHFKILSENNNLLDLQKLIQSLRGDYPNKSDAFMILKIKDALNELEFQQLIWFGNLSDEDEQKVEQGDEDILYIGLKDISQDRDRQIKQYPYPSINICLKNSQPSNPAKTPKSEIKKNEKSHTGKSFYKSSALLAEEKMRLPQFLWLKKWCFDKNSQEYFPIVSDEVVEFYFVKNKKYFSDRAHARSALQQPGKIEVINDIYEEMLNDQRRAKETNSFKETLLISSANKTFIDQDNNKSHVLNQSDLSTLNIQAKSIEEYIREKEELSKLALLENFNSYNSILASEQIPPALFNMISNWVEKNSDFCELIEIDVNVFKIIYKVEV